VREHQKCTKVYKFSKEIVVKSLDYSSAPQQFGEVKTKIIA